MQLFVILKQYVLTDLIQPDNPNPLIEPTLSARSQPPKEIMGIDYYSTRILLVDAEFARRDSQRRKLDRSDRAFVEADCASSVFNTLKILLDTAMYGVAGIHAILITPNITDMDVHTMITKIRKMKFRGAIFGVVPVTDKPRWKGLLGAGADALVASPVNSSDFELAYEGEFE